MAPPTSTTPTPVYDAVVEEKSADELRDVIIACSGGGRATRRQEHQLERIAAAKAAVNTPGTVAPRSRKELPLAAARRLGRGDLASVLVGHGAEVEPVFGPNATPIAVCIGCGDDDAESVRALLRSGGERAAQPIRYDPDERAFAAAAAATGGRRGRDSSSASFLCTAAHLCVVPPLLLPISAPSGGGSGGNQDEDENPGAGDDDDDDDGSNAAAAAAAARLPRPRLRCLEVLVREGNTPGLINAIDSFCTTALAWLVDSSHSSDHVRAVRTLLRLGADPNAGAIPPVVYWIARDQGPFPIVPCLRVLVKAGARASAEGGAINLPTGDSALMLAARRCHVPALEFLLDETEAAEDVNLLNRKTGALPLTCCGMIGPVVGPLLSAGADPNKKDRSGNLPLLQAMREGIKPEAHPLAPLLMLKAGAKVEGVRGPQGRTPLIMACERWKTWLVSDNRVALLDELIERTPVEERRVTRRADGASAIDLIAGEGLTGDMEAGFVIEHTRRAGDEEMDEEAMNAWSEAAMERTFEANRRFVAQLRIDGVSVLPENEEMVQGVVASVAVPMLARRLRGLEAEMAVRRSESRRWRGHDDIVGLAFDFLELREAEEGVRRREARVAELEGEVGGGEEGEEESGGDGMEEDE
jgi:ankyrin repeat protein